MRNFKKLIILKNTNKIKTYYTVRGPDSLSRSKNKT